MDAFERPKLLTETVLAHIRSAIVSGDLPLGSALSERQLAQRLNVSKTPVREALVQLKTEGLVDIFPQRGAYVFTLAAREVVEMCEFRLTIESAALGFSLERNPGPLADDVDRVVESMDHARSAADVRAYLSLDTEFHAAFFRHCGNGYLRDSYQRYVGKIAALRTHLATKPMHTELSFQEHCRLRDIIRSDNATEARDVLRAHIGRTRETYSLEVEDIAAADSLSG
ncbi:MAG: GntR family transcriptional regulator [Rhizobiaceae bacterium]|jgi:DNA-binding GntR family transcriptional regulator|nr:MAG: GntR family transcriptional regulator [Rhizobiaceae bacterium]